MPQPTQLQKRARTALQARYQTALRTHLRARRTGPNPRARALGRAALAAGLVTLDLAIMHERAVALFSSSPHFADPARGALRRAGEFFTQALVPLEADQRATRLAVAHLRQRNLALHAHTAAAAKANLRLRREVARREAAEATARRGKDQYHTLFLESQVMQRKLRQLTRQIISAQEEERKEISRELHDEVVQTLVGINVELTALGQGTYIGYNSLKAKIARTQKLVENSVNAVHRFARELRPAVLDDLGLIPALHAYCRNLAARKRIKIRMTAFGGVEALGDAKRIALFRVAQEALTNVARHARATKVELRLTQIPGGVRMEIHDNGQSFAVEKVLRARNPKRLGLVGMRERIEMVGGRLTIESIPGQGTTVRTDLPLDSSPANP